MYQDLAHDVLYLVVIVYISLMPYGMALRTLDCTQNQIHVLHQSISSRRDRAAVLHVPADSPPQVSHSGTRPIRSSSSSDPLFPRISDGSKLPIDCTEPLPLAKKVTLRSRTKPHAKSVINSTRYKFEPDISCTDSIANLMVADLLP